MEIVRRGTWQYDDGVHLPVTIISLPYDFWFELAKADDQLEPDDKPEPLGEDGQLFYVSFQSPDLIEAASPDSSGLPTIEAAMEAAHKRVAPPIRWEVMSEFE